MNAPNAHSHALFSKGRFFVEKVRPAGKRSWDLVELLPFQQIAHLCCRNSKSQPLVEIPLDLDRVPLAVSAQIPLNLCNCTLVVWHVQYRIDPAQGRTQLTSQVARQRMNVLSSASAHPTNRSIR